MAIGAMQTVQTNGLQVGKQIAITGFDDIPLVHYMHPPLTSVRQPIWEIGQRVIGILLGILDGQETLDTQVLIPPRLIIRESSGSGFAE